ncbi:SPL family radical SAM protein [Paenibacillus sp. FSL K6-2524]|uniref:SPL family radical SAM protein n=1 Tax=Paenibacillus sp. FSL K6-2524 TaxID=2954516 RepID=UPI0030FB65AA
MVHEIEARTLLSRQKQPENWFGVDYNLNVYRGCVHGCIYCDSRSECYGIEVFEDIAVKKNAVQLLKKELAGKRHKGMIGTGSMSDPYMPIERSLRLTRGVLETIAAAPGFAVQTVTKSDLIVRDADVLQEISQRTHATVAVSISTCDEEQASWIEPHAPAPAARLQALATLAKQDIYSGVLLMPTLPFLTDSRANIVKIVERAHASGAQFIIPWLGMSLRDRQRDYYYEKLAERAPGLVPQYQRTYGERYNCMSPRAKSLWELLHELCDKYGVVCEMKDVKRFVPPEPPEQLQLF